MAVHTWVMSPAMMPDALPRMALPMQNSGSITSIPMRIVHVSAIHPISGRINRPGMTHSEAMENPVARARAGIASDSVARMAGASTASSTLTTQFRATATAMCGDRAKATRTAADDRQMRDSQRTRPATSLAKRRVAMRAP